MRIFKVIFFIFLALEVMGQDSIPHSIIKGGGFYNIDLGDNLNEKGRILLFNRKGAIIGIGEIPFALFATPSFCIKNLPEEGINRLPQNIEKTLFDIQEIYLQSDFKNYEFSNEIPPEIYPEIPEWICNYKKVVNLSLDHISLNQLNSIRCLPIEKLVLKNIKFEDQSKVIEAINAFIDLKIIAFDASFPKILLREIKRKDITIKELP